MNLKLIAAACENMGIGINNDLPWRLPKEMQYFSKMTTTCSNPEKRNCVIMGHRTWLSMPKSILPLKGRINIVLSRQLKEPPEGAHYLANSMEECLNLLEKPPLCDEIESVWVIGGTQIYKEALESPHCKYIYLTRIMAAFECDTFFPDIPHDKFKLIKDPDVPDTEQEEKGIHYTFEVYKRS